jgi:hypothetical protein
MPISNRLVKLSKGQRVKWYSRKKSPSGFVGALKKKERKNKKNEKRGWLVKTWWRDFSKEKKMLLDFFQTNK